MRKLIVGLLALFVSVAGVTTSPQPVAASSGCGSGNITQSSPTKYGGQAGCQDLNKAVIGTGQEYVQVKLKCATGGVATPNVFRLGTVQWLPGTFARDGIYSVYWCGDTAGDGLNVLAGSVSYVVGNDPAPSGCSVSWVSPPAANPGTASANCTSLPGHTDVVRVEMRCKTATNVVDWSGLHLGSWIGTAGVNSTTSCDSYYPYPYAVAYNITST